MKFLSNFELPLSVSCSRIDIKVVISIKYGWNTIAWAKVKHLGHFIQNVWGVSKISKFCQHGQNFWNLIFSIRKYKVIYILPKQNSAFGHIIFTRKHYNEIFDKIVFMSLKTGQKWNFNAFWEAVSHFFFDTTVHIFLISISSSGQR